MNSSLLPAGDLGITSRQPGPTTPGPATPGNLGGGRGLDQRCVDCIQHGIVCKLWYIGILFCTCGCGAGAGHQSIMVTLSTQGVTVLGGTLHTALHTEHCTVYCTLYCTLNCTLHCTALHTAEHTALHTVLHTEVHTALQCTLSTELNCTLCTAHCIVYNQHFTGEPLHCTLECCVVEQPWIMQMLLV